MTTARSTSHQRSTGFSRRIIGLLQLATAPQVFLWIAIPVMLYFAFFLLPGDPPDERNHVFRAASLALGSLIATPDGVLNGLTAWGAPLPSNLVSGLNLTSGAGFSPVLEPLESSYVFADFSNTAVYSPVVYIPAMLGYRIASFFGMNVLAAVLIMRLLNVGVYLALGVLSLRILRSTNLRWVVLTVLLSPVALYEGSFVTGDAVTNSVLILFASLVLRELVMRERLTEKLGWLLVAIVILIPLLKPTYAILVLLFLLVRSIPLWKRAVTFIVSAALGLAWQKIGTDGSDGIRGILLNPEQAQSVSMHDQMQWILMHPVDAVFVFLRSWYYSGVDWALQSVGQVGFMWDGAAATAAIIPLEALALFMFALTLATGSIPRLAVSRLTTGIMVISVLGVIFLVMLSLYLTITPVGNEFIWGLQGRYFLPIVLFVIILAAHVPARLRPVARENQTVAPAVEGAPALMRVEWMIASLTAMWVIILVWHVVRYHAWYLQWSWPMSL